MPKRPRKSTHSAVETPIPEDAEKIGYGRPPKAHRFKKGRSGNPGGRPAKTPSLSRALEKALMKRITIRVEGRALKVTKLEAAMRKLADLATEGDARIVRLLLAEMHRADERRAEEPATQEGLSDADHEVIAALMKRIGGRDEGR